VAAPAEEIRRVAQDVFGFKELKPGQLECVEAVLNGRDTLAVMATGYGKSAIYQIAGVLLDGPTLVVSPLIALQRDQVENLEDPVAGGAAQVASTVPESEREQALRDARRDRLEFLFMSPEQLANDEVLEQVKRARPSLLVVDEAHCISEWGHDFRPDYLRLGAVADQLGRPPVLALTATAAPPVREEILARLGMDDPHVQVSGFDRPNLWFGVERFHDEAAKERTLVERVAEADKPGIVYTATRKEAERLADDLTAAGVNAAAYHGGMAAGRREEVQTAFMDDDTDVIVATTAFGMGVDKPNVRFVIHHAIADSVDAYWQEVGRAGRDGEPARALLLYRAQDVGLRRFFAGGGQVDESQIEEVAKVIDAAAGPVEPSDLRDDTELSESKLTTAVGRLEDVGAVDVLPSGQVAAAVDDVTDHVAEAAQVQEDREAFDRSRIDMIRGYAELRGACRREYLLSYFGEETSGPCGNCDLCDAGEAQASAEGPFEVGARVEHPKWGEATVQRYEGDKVVVLFDSVGYKSLVLDVAEDLLTRK
jgi:ATP-dependent DNA helicase RecQ